MPTGTGKTVTFAALPGWPGIKEWLETFPARQRGMLVIAHREELLDQAAEKLRARNPGLQVSIEQGDRHAYLGSDVVIASIQTLAAREFTRLRRLLQRFTPRIVIIDEAHHAAASTYRTALVHLGFLPPADASDVDNVESATFDDVLTMETALNEWDQIAPKDRLLVGVTATPNRSDAVGLNCVFQTIAFSYDLKQAIADRLLVPMVPWVVETATSLDEVRITAGEFNQKDLAEAVNTVDRNKLAVAGWLDHAKDRSTIAFTVNVAHAHDLAAAFSQYGISAMPVSAETPREERHQILADFTAGRIQVITNCMVLTEGTDLPRTSCILHAKPTRSATLYEQMTGRGLRLFPQKRDCILLDVVDVSRRHSLQTAAMLYGLPTGVLVNGDPLDEVARRYEKLREDYPNLDLEKAFANGQHLTLAQLQAKASTFDVWSVKPLGVFGEDRKLNWLKVNDDEYRLSYPWADGTETLAVRRDLVGKWEVATTLRVHADGSVRQQTKGANISTAEAAAVVAEEWVNKERHSITRLKGKDAAWMKRPATEKQLAVLQRRGVPIRKGLTGLEASNLIDISAKRWR